MKSFKDYLKETVDENGMGLHQDTKTSKATNQVLSDKQKEALDHAYQLLEDINAHTENTQIDSFVAEKYNIDFNKEIYGSFYKGNVGDEGKKIGWDVTKGIKLANKLIKMAGLSLVIIIRDHHEI